MEDVEKIVLKMIGSQSHQNQYNLFKIKASWADIIGNNNARHCSPLKLERRILTLQVDSSVWANQFLYYKEQFIGQINHFMCSEYIKDIKFVMGQSFKKSSKSKKHSKAEENTIPFPPATEEENAALHLKFAYISNENIKNAIVSIEEKRLGLEKLYRERKIKKCPVCGDFLKNGEVICYTCETEKRKENAYEITEKIKKEPWIRWQDIKKIIACDETEFNIIKNDIKAFYFEKVRLKTADESEEKFAVQLKAGKPYALLSEKEYENILKFLQKGK